MKFKDLLITPRDPIILRDGRPFGQSGVPQSGTLAWPRPGTVAGMARSYIGTLRSPDYFQIDTAAHIEEIKRVSVAWFLPAVFSQGSHALCFPAPADGVVFPEKEGQIQPDHRLEVKPLTPVSTASGEGADLPWPEWLYPWVEDRRKPVNNPPSFWHWSQMKSWLIDGTIGRMIQPEELGIGLPETEERTHVTIDPGTGSAAESHLFTTMGLRFRTDIRLAARIGMEPADNLPETDMAVLGGDRRPVFLTWKDRLIDWPEAPPEIGKAVGFRLILTSPGLFSQGWLPGWLKESLDTNRFIEIPGTTVKLRLRSACIPRWQPCHGWDMGIGKSGAPKPLRKMVPAGAVYFTEVEPRADKTVAVQTLWNRSLCESEQDIRDGFGRILVGNWHIPTHS